MSILITTQPHYSPFQFPFELERDIFEISARAHRGMALQLVLVAHRVQSWIDFIIYETVALFDPMDARRFLRAIESKPASFFVNVKTLLIAYHVEHEQILQILQVCTGVVNLACWVDNSPSLPSIASLRPRLLSLRQSVSSPTPDFSLPLYEDVTHLEFVNMQESWGSHSGFDLLPRLTHLALYFDIERPKAAEEIGHILTSCTTLRVFVVYKYEPCGPRTGLDFVGDPRLVFVQFPDHRRNFFIVGKPDMWSDAEATVKTQLSEVVRYGGPGALMKY